jgi:hypothetical protein
MEDEFMSQEDFLTLMMSPRTTVELVAQSGLKIRTVRSRLARLMQQGKVREIYTLKDMRMRRYVKV